MCWMMLIYKVLFHLNLMLIWQHVKHHDLSSKQGRTLPIEHSLFKDEKSTSGFYLNTYKDERDHYSRFANNKGYLNHRQVQERVHQWSIVELEMKTHI